MVRRVEGEAPAGEASTTIGAGYRADQREGAVLLRWPLDAWATVGRRSKTLVGFVTLGIAVGWVLYEALKAGLGSSGNMPTFVLTTLNGISLAGLYFVTASGFTLIFGLMRVVNMAHGSLYLLGGYIAWSLASSGMNWWAALVVAMSVTGAVGLVMEQLFLRWNFGQDIRQALITVAISVIMADQMLARFGAVAQTLNAPSGLGGSLALGIYGLGYPVFRLFVIGAAVVIGAGMALGMKRTRFGMVVRAGVDDRAMASALGVNVQVVFGVAFWVGSALAGLGGVFGATVLSLAPGQDQIFLVSSLIVVIVGGMGSLGGAALGALLLGLVQQLSEVYLPPSYTNYAILVTFVLLVVVLTVKPRGLFGKAR
jgi:branched-chain amino acid transport system permease protein